jgi:hypothetical protein
MSITQDIIYNVTGQVVYFDAPEGRPSSVTSVTVFAADTGDDGSAEFTPTGAVETNPNTTVDANSGAGQTNPRTLNVAATTGFEVGRQFLVTGAGTEHEWFEVAEISSAASVTTRNPLHNAYVSSDTVESTRIEFTIDATWVANVNKISGIGPNPGYRVRWVYVVTPPGGVSQTVVHHTYLDLLRYTAQYSVTPADMDQRYPGWLEQLPTYHRESQGRGIIEQGYHYLKAELAAAGRADEGARNAEMTDELVLRAAKLLSEQARFDAGGDADRLSAANEQFYGLLGKLVTTSSVVPFAADTTGAGSTVSPSAIFRR